MTTPAARLDRPTIGIGFILLAVLAFSVNDMLIKFLSGGYPLHQVVFIRSVIAICFSLGLVRMEGGLAILRTRTPGLHALRAALIITANLTFFAALAVLPLAETTAVFFVAPLLITLLSVPFLGERVGLPRLAAVTAGLAGVVIITRPWQAGAARETSLVIYLLPIVAAFAYAFNQILTRKLGASSRASAMAVYIQGGFILVSLMFWAVAGDGRYAARVEHESLVFLLRAWVWPAPSDIRLLLLLGLVSAVIGYSLSQAYRMADAATIAPFEYAALPLAVFWGWAVWGELPDAAATLGIALILGAGVFVFLRERQKQRYVAGQQHIPRRY